MGPRWGLGGARDPRGRCLFPLPPAGTTPATPLWYCLCHSGPPPLPLWLLTAWPGGAAWCHAALGRGLVVVWLYERPGLAFPYPLRVHPVRCLPAAWLHSSVATSEPLVTRERTPSSFRARDGLAGVPLKNCALVSGFRRRDGLRAVPGACDVGLARGERWPGVAATTAPRLNESGSIG